MLHKLLSQITLLEVLDFLELCELLAYSTTSINANLICTSEYLWRKFCRKEQERNPSIHFSNDNCWKQKVKSLKNIHGWRWKDDLRENGIATPSPRFLHRMAKCPETDDIYLFGGSGDMLYNDLWHFKRENGHIRASKFQFSSNNQVPEARMGGSLVAFKHYIFLFGGATDIHGHFFDDLWCFHTGCQQWRQCNISDTFFEVQETLQTDAHRMIKPDERWAHTMVTYQDKMVLFGGSSPGKTMNDTWILQSEMTIDSVRSSEPIMNEHGFDHLFPKMVWQKITVEGCLPAQRSGHAAAVYDKFMYIFGGNSLRKTFNDLYRMDLSKFDKWERIHIHDLHLLSPRIGHSMIALDNKLIIYGGRNIHTKKIVDQGLVILDLNRGAWKIHQFPFEPKPPTGHSTVLFPDGFLVFGGFKSLSASTSSFSNDLYFVSFDENNHQDNDELAPFEFRPQNWYLKYVPLMTLRIANCAVCIFGWVVLFFCFGYFEMNTRQD